MLAFIYALLSSFFISLITLIVIPFFEKIKKYLIYIISFATGIFIGAFFLNLLPNLYKNSQNAEVISLIILISFLSFFLIENFLHFHHHGEEHHRHHLGVLNLIGDFFHNFVDGLSIAAAFKVSPQFGLIITLAIAAHEIPQEFGDFSILLYSGFDKLKALVLNFLVGLSSVLGVIVGYFLDVPVYYLLAIVAGSFLYIGASDLIPLLAQVNKDKKIKVLILFFLGLIFIKLIHLLIESIL